MKETTEDDQRRPLPNPQRWESELERLDWCSVIPEDHAFLFIARPVVGLFTAVLLGSSLLCICALLYRVFVTILGVSQLAPSDTEVWLFAGVGAAIGPIFAVWLCVAYRVKHERYWKILEEVEAAEGKEFADRIVMKIALKHSS